MKKPARYHPALVITHWLSAFLIIFMLAFGSLVLARTPNDSAKLAFLTIHMVTGLTILVLTIIRIIARLVTPRPAPATTGNKILDKIGQITHGLLYLGALGMGISGLGIATQSGLFQMALSGDWTMSGGFFQYPPRIGHQYVAWGMDALILLHIAAALYHQVIRKDGLMQRMSTRKR